MFQFDMEKDDWDFIHSYTFNGQVDKTQLRIDRETERKQDNASIVHRNRRSDLQKNNWVNVSEKHSSDEVEVS